MNKEIISKMIDEMEKNQMATNKSVEIIYKTVKILYEELIKIEKKLDDHLQNITL